MAEDAVKEAKNGLEPPSKADSHWIHSPIFLTRLLLRTGVGAMEEVVIVVSVGFDEPVDEPVSGADRASARAASSCDAGQDDSAWRGSRAAGRDRAPSHPRMLLIPAWPAAEGLTLPAQMGEGPVPCHVDGATTVTLELLAPKDGAHEIPALRLWRPARTRHVTPAAWIGCWLAPEWDFATSRPLERLCASLTLAGKQRRM